LSREDFLVEVQIRKQALIKQRKQKRNGVEPDQDVPVLTTKPDGSTCEHYNSDEGSTKELGEHFRQMLSPCFLCCDLTIHNRSSSNNFETILEDFLLRSQDLMNHRKQKRYGVVPES
jgi:hypothetical protein